jgi:hypothetical protein
VDLNADVTQSKILIDPLLRGLLEDERKIDHHIFWVILKTSFKRLFFGALLEMLCCEMGWDRGIGGLES